MDQEIILETFKKQPFCLLATDELFEPPTGQDLKFIRKLFKLTQIDTAKIVGVAYTKKGSTTVSKWEIERNKFDHRQIPYSAWRLLLVTLKVVKG